ncbi:ABC transporter permease [Alkalihalobacillus sp. CinArs1]|uniref:ABC transporter permease n=1 Tax=Alkalihalobacillus sp. CinArs1 TaxID=2995314 RepID=UPI0022DE3749|nr:hypothetical protein [Alkalihalobacillus sp. CinArs1]
MMKWLIQWKFELSFLYRSWFLLPMPFLFLIWLIVSMTVENVSSSDSLYVSAYRTTHSTIFILVIGLSILIGVYLMRRDIGNESFEWHRALPVSNFVFLSAKFIAGITYMSFFTFLMALTFSAISIRQQLPFAETIEVLRFFIIQYEVSLIISLALGMILSVIIQNRFVYLIAFCAWIFGTLFMEVYILNGIGNFNDTGNFYLKPFHLSYLFLDSILVNGVWGIELMKEEIKLQRLFVLSFSLMLLMGTLFFLNRKRPNEHDKLWSIVCSFSLLGAILAYIPYNQFWDVRISAFNNVAKGSPTFSQTSDNSSIYMWDPNLKQDTATQESSIYKRELFEILSYRIDIDQTPNSTLDLKAAVSLQHDQFDNDEIKFTLNRVFSLNDVKVDQESIAFEQDGDFVTITLPNEVNNPTIHFNYGGVYELWTHRGSQEYYPGFAMDNQIVMPSHTAWYPLPAHQYLVDSDGESRTDVGLLQPTDFHVNVTGVDNTVYGSIKHVESSGETHTLSGKTARLDLFSGFLTKIEADHYHTSLVTAPYRKDASKEFMKEVDTRLTYFDEFLDDEIDPVHHFFFLPLDQLRWSGYFRQDGFIDQNYIMNDYNSLNHHATINDFVIVNLFHEDNFVSGNYRPEDALLTSTIKAAFNYVYELEHGKEEEAFETRSAFANITDEQDERNYSKEIIQTDKLLDMIETAMHEGKEEEVKEVLNRIYHANWSGNGYPTGYDLYIEPASTISFEEWMEVWNDVMNTKR